MYYGDRKFNCVHHDILYLEFVVGTKEIDNSMMLQFTSLESSNVTNAFVKDISKHGSKDVFRQLHQTEHLIVAKDECPVEFLPPHQIISQIPGP